VLVVIAFVRKIYILLEKCAWDIKEGNNKNKFGKY
tara:strand:+ start:88 stop:192 length:105 start_codon:yes stop_codon:yes gene_type:complete